MGDNETHKASPDAACTAENFTSARLPEYSPRQPYQRLPVVA